MTKDKEATYLTIYWEINDLRRQRNRIAAELRDVDREIEDRERRISLMALTE